MKRSICTLFFSIFLLTSSFGQEKSDKTVVLSKDKLVKIFEEFKKAENTVFRKGSSVEDVDKLYSFYTKDFTYNHPKYGGIYSRKELYDNTVKYLKKGAYDNFPKRKITNMIVGLNMIVTEQSEEGKDASLVTLYKFKGNKIYYIEEYW